MLRLNISLILLTTLLISSCKNYDEIPCIPTDLKDNVRAFYSFNQGSLNDNSLEGNNLTMHGLPTTKNDRFGNKDCAFHFDRINDDYLTANGGFLNDFHQKEFSISIWYYGDSIDILNQFPDYELLLGRVDLFKLQCPSQYGEWSVGLYDCRKPVGSVNSNSTWYNIDTLFLGQEKICELIASDLSEKWSHIVFTFDKNKLLVYFNGILEYNFNQNGCGGISKNLGNLIIGHLFTGSIDDVIIFNKELSASEVTELYEMEPCCE